MLKKAAAASSCCGSSAVWANPGWPRDPFFHLCCFQSWEFHSPPPINCSPVPYILILGGTYHTEELQKNGPCGMWAMCTVSYIYTNTSWLFSVLVFHWEQLPQETGGFFFPLLRYFWCNFLFFICIHFSSAGQELCLEQMTKSFALYHHAANCS